jgi:hypothetical protein
MMILVMKMMTMGGYAPPLHIRSWKTEAPGANAFSISQSENIVSQEPRYLTDSRYLSQSPINKSALELPLDLD